MHNYCSVSSMLPCLASLIKPACNKYSIFPSFSSIQCPDSACKQDLLAYLQRIALYCHQLNICSKVKAEVQNLGGELIVSGVSPYWRSNSDTHYNQLGDLNAGACSNLKVCICIVIETRPYICTVQGWKGKKLMKFSAQNVSIVHSRCMCLHASHVGRNIFTHTNICARVCVFSYSTLLFNLSLLLFIFSLCLSKYKGVNGLYQFSQK